jgi:hypothetical protein
MAVERLAVFELDKHGVALSGGKQPQRQLEGEPSASDDDLARRFFRNY